MTNNTELFSIHSTVNNFPHAGEKYNNIAIQWFVRHRENNPVVPYDVGILDYDTSDEMSKYNEQGLDELFTKDEADAFKAWLIESFGLSDDTTGITKHDLPLKGRLGFGALAVGGHDGWALMRNFENYSLPFDVEGYYDTREHTGAVQV